MYILKQDIYMYILKQNETEAVQIETREMSDSDSLIDKSVIDESHAMGGLFDESESESEL